MTTYTEIEKKNYRPTCPQCGSRLSVQWILATKPIEDRESQYVAGEERCLNPECRGRVM